MIPNKNDYWIMTTKNPYLSARTVLSVAAASALALTAACGGSQNAQTSNADNGATEVVASFYPLAHAVEKVGGKHVKVTNLTGNGQDPHHVELTPQQVGSVSNAGLVVYEKGMQPSADSAIESAGAKQILDLSKLAALPSSGAEEDDHDGHDHDGHDHDGHDHGKESPSATKTDAHDDHDGHDHEGHNHGPNDPHFWLDPVLYSQAVDQIAAKLGEIDPTNKQAYSDNATAYKKELSDLDNEYKQGLSKCTVKDIVTGHTSFAYLAKRYGLNQVGLAGVLNDGEPDPARLAEISNRIKANKVTTVYAEKGEKSASVDAVANETKTKRAELDNVAVSMSGGYIDRMKNNLGVLRTGQGCA
ncbi:metal ABC transporter substrate-binding protein [Dermatophilus congolensis]|uniref:metal ABC transporter substrate-binding protein n=2 Tax=Dermatophilus congolensis TaxID=1863 RepID=UPI001AAFB501|nr:metal ABC transporter substrate-binding protein [Dermatophilus congolensis]MBO3152684.1 zinc ABC transporter substrate-binding protein [Dermatophilus congolensis]MBO3160306.1 zinc ABC transporter substrate-binding protein [Dermatophilus congolensis]MBO3163968.1 zinc ABC transporter substrate-binding protein [Dermatophilus congolensis]MBO3177514.1 zinc ABC transporter substrate-binding protein [Dermatophilus congolensis]MBO3206796.1 zinc ABC transporter substrate-binding protein [Dermatophil